MMRKTTYTIVVILTSLLAIVSCSSDELAKNETQGRIRLSLSCVEAYMQTRAVQEVNDISDFVFTLVGTTIENDAVNEVVSFDAAQTALVPAGTYTLTANNSVASQTGEGTPYYQGTSSSFTIAKGGTQDVSIALGKPQNAKLTMLIDASFEEFYGQPTLVLSDGIRSVTMTTANAAYFPADATVTYTLTADAKAGSKVTDIKNATGTIAITSSCHTTITLKASPVTGFIISVADGMHTGEFD